ncbi:hypothetical protein XELAEV_18036660mg [Xenopus laevis]|uniref:Uncharacterized protein n=1 Tax=Xenopus laevis TaxID=8355 RepID=A0A974H9X9_XENLA|nr:hypothetical protein XELAEV_18036660mg [Xenopus laevis]
MGPAAFSIGFAFHIFGHYINIIFVYTQYLILYRRLLCCIKRFVFVFLMSAYLSDWGRLFVIRLFAFTAVNCFAVSLLDYSRNIIFRLQLGVRERCKNNTSCSFKVTPANQALKVYS